jgi:hypothetical protein
MMAQGVPILYGRCDGGPWHMKHLAHHEAVYVVPIEQFSKKVVVGVRPGTAGYSFGEYRFESPHWIYVTPETCAQQKRPK